MPWHIGSSASCPKSKPYAVIKDSDGSVCGCHPTKAAAKKQLAALYANEPGANSMADAHLTPEDLADVPPARLPFPVTRAVAAPPETSRAWAGDMPTMSGHFSTFNDWYEVDSWIEGHFLERIAPGAFAKTIRKSNEARGAMKVLYDHGQDPQIGNKILGPIARLEEDSIGPAYEVPLLDTSYNRDLVPGLEAGLYGSSFRFAVSDDDWDRTPSHPTTTPTRFPSERSPRHAYSSSARSPSRPTPARQPAPARRPTPSTSAPATPMSSSRSCAQPRSPARRIPA